MIANRETSAGDPASIILARAPALDRRRGERLAVRVIALATVIVLLAAAASLVHGVQG